MKKSKFRLGRPPGSAGKSVFILSILFLLLTVLLISPLAAATSWEISPENPSVGDTLKITGTADPGQTLRATVSFGKNVMASGGTYIYEIEKVEIPDGKNNLFTVQAKNIRDLNVKVTKGVPLITLSKDASGGQATISQGHVPPWKYKVKIFGRPLEEESEVSITIKAEQDLEVDSNGNFVYNYDTGTLPPGEFDITIGKKTETIIIKEKGKTSGSGSETKPQTISGTTMPEPQPAPAEPPVLDEQDEIEETSENAPKEVRGQLEEEDEALESSSSTSSEENTAKSETPEPTLDGSYLLIGLVAGLLINAVHLKRK